MILGPGPAGGTHVSLLDPGAVKGSLIHPYTQHPEES